jgi:BNR repeat-like domain
MKAIPLLSMAVAATLLARCAQEERASTPAASRPAPATVQASQPLQTLPSPAGPNSAEPFLFTTRNGVGLSWLEPVVNSDRVALRFAIHSNGQWSAPKTILERNDLFVNWADFPSVIEDANGTLFTHWLQKSGAGTYSYDVRMAASTDGGTTWGEPFLLNRDGEQSEHGFVSLAALPGGGIGAAWLDGRNMKMGADHDSHEPAGDMTIRYASVDARGNLQADTELDQRACECCTTGMAVASSGPVIVYRDRSAAEIRDVSYVHRNANGWSAPKPVRADGWKMNGCPVNGPQIDAIGDSVATAWFTAADEQQRVYVAFSEDGGKTFGEAIRIDDGKPAGRVDLVLLDPQTAVVAWLEQTAAGAEIRARRVSRTASAVPSVKVADSLMARASGFTRLARVGGDVWFTWTEQGANSKKLHLARGRF